MISNTQFMNLLLLPEVTFFFKKDMFPGSAELKNGNIGEEILLRCYRQKEIAPAGTISMENIFPSGRDGESLRTIGRGRQLSRLLPEKECR